MPAIIKSNISSELVKSFYNALQSKTTQLYYMLGKPSEWDNDNFPPAPETNENYELELRKNSIRFQQVALSNISLMIRRVNWEAGTVYDMYDTRNGEKSLAESNMFVLTDDFNLYKCIDNNYGAASTVKPTSTGTEYIELEDGYVWKFMKTLTSTDRTRYLTPNYIPVSNPITGSYFNGGIVSVTVNDIGGGYDASNTVINVVDQDGTGAVFEPVIDNGAITNVVVKNPGEGYTQATLEVVTPDTGLPQGTGASISPVIGSIDLNTSQTDVVLSSVDGEISTIKVREGGTGYNPVNTTAQIVGNGRNAIVTPIIEAGVITGFVYNNRGSGYSNAKVIVTGDGEGFEGDVIIAPEGGHGYSLIDESYPTALMTFLSSTDSELLSVETPEVSYRQAAIITNPYQYGTTSSTKFRGSSGTSCWLIQDPNLSGDQFDVGELFKLQGSSNTPMRIVAIEDGKMLLQIPDTYEPKEGDVLAKVDANAVVINNNVYTIPQNITPPNVDRFSGKVIYIDNRPPFKSDLNQIVNIRTLIKF